MDLLLGGVERQVAHVEGCRVLQLVLKLRAGTAFVVVATPSTLLVIRISIFVCQLLNVRTLAVAYELGLSRRSMVLLTPGIMLEILQTL